jgi:hypothetical protein
MATTPHLNHARVVDTENHFIAKLKLVILVLAVDCDMLAATINTSSFTDIPDAVYVNGSGYGLLLTTGDLTMTSSSLYGSGTFTQYVPPGTASDPGDGSGYLASYRAPSPVGDITIDFSRPVAGFGVTFLHLSATTLARWGMHLPGLIRAYAGPNGTGDLLGSVTSTGWFPTARGYNFDFVAVMSTAVDIQSVVIGGALEPKGFAADAYAYSLTPVPEPSGAVLLSLGLVALWRKKCARQQGN